MRITVPKDARQLSGVIIRGAHRAVRLPNAQRTQPSNSLGKETSSLPSEQPDSRLSSLDYVCSPETRKAVSETFLPLIVPDVLIGAAAL